MIFSAALDDAGCDPETENRQQRHEIMHLSFICISIVSILPMFHNRFKDPKIKLFINQI